MPEQKLADEAVRQIGTNAIPTLLRMARARDSALTLKLIGLARKQHWIKINHTSASVRNIEAVYGFRQLGADGKDAVPALIEICEQNLSRTSQETIPAALGYIGPAAKQAIPVLLRCATNTNPVVRGNAIYALGQIHGDPELVLPVLIRSLHDSDHGVRGDAAFAVGAFGARQAVPTLLELLKDELESTREEAAEALKKIDPAAAANGDVK
ncbi:MAG TPA: HEAT repeat domain-containing protein [Candidatus Angelobacter sp.]|nr:HEAT repeat domain-containing protein [Candidatus Angelobacter sp.]